MTFMCLNNIKFELILNNYSLELIKKSQSLWFFFSLFFKFNANDEHEREHMLEHLKNMIGDKDTAQMTPEELQFYYFKQHDYDNNNKLDGIELIQGKLNIKFQKKL